MTSRRASGRPLVLVASLLATGVLVAPGLAAGAAPMHVVVLVGSGPHAIGSVVPVTIHVFYLGTHEDADSLVVTVNPGTTSLRTIPATRIGMGEYRADFRVAQEDVDATGSVVFFAAAAIGSVFDVARAMAFVRTGTALDLILSRASVAPGETLQIEFTVRVGDILTDPDRASISVGLRTSAGFHIETLPVVRRSTGEFGATYVVPVTINADAFLDVLGAAQIDGERYVTVTSATVNWAEFVEVWYHPIRVDRDSADIELWAAYLDGRPVPDALIHFGYAYVDRFTFRLHTSFVASATDARGVATFSLAFPGALFPIAVEGSVRKDMQLQDFGGEIFEAATVTSGLHIFRADLDVAAALPGAPVSYDYVLYHDRAPSASTTVHFVAHTDEFLVASGSVETDAAGAFEISVPAQATGMWIDFQAFIDGTWFETSDFRLATAPLDATFDEIFVGSRTTITAPLPTSESVFAYAWFTPVDLSGEPWERFETGWVRWSGAYSEFAWADTEDGNLTLTLVIPRYLPKGQDYLLTVLAVPAAYGPGDSLYAKNWVLRLENLLPTLRVDVSSFTIVEGSTVRVDTSDSVDLDGDIIAYAVDWGDGLRTDWLAEPRFSHTYETPGTYEIRVSIKDDNGGIAEYTATLAVRSRVVEFIRSPLGAASIAGAIVAGNALTAALAFRRKPRLRDEEPRNG